MEYIALERICIGMYLEYYSIKRFFFFCHFGENFRIFAFFAFFALLFGWYWKEFLDFVLMER
ncbi:hypothetical protein BB464_00425 [Helicobacter pylori]|nr:hypothetical protein BB464_00425 [Helicobacter pylori]